ncbi:hypothetical protein COLO4_12977 [Corchorus olitorius]|uniref:Uncharacterized protein n=1 Tax=Corchorus olitorius TaxID=93759 RepID=A0A1R3JZ53_9ROSI|nr:hypothetical protein COLO4_12977 [Corchorus olitorius]
MEAAEAEEVLKVLDASLFTIKWRLKSSAKRRLQIDVLALCTGMRPVVMIDYGGKMPELQERLCAFLEHCQKEASIFEQLRVMIIEEMIYLVHVEEMAKYVSSSLGSEVELLFVDLEQDPPKMKTLDDKNLLGMQFISIQKLFSLYFPLEGLRNDLLPPDTTELRADAGSVREPINSQSSLLMDLSCCMHDTKVTVPTLNGWLLGYPLVYLFSTDHIEDAIYNLSTKFLRIYKILVCRFALPDSCLYNFVTPIISVMIHQSLNNTPNKGSQPEELMSFSVPYDLSMRGSNEPWAETFLGRLQSKWGRCKQTWSSLEMEVSECYPQAIAL